MNACCDAGWSPLHKAVSKKELGHVELLVDHGANINARSANGRTPLCQAVKISNVFHESYSLLDRGVMNNILTRVLAIIQKIGAQNWQL